MFINFLIFIIMAFNPFKPSVTPVDKPNRNAFDLSFSNHITTNFGTLVPVMCKETLPGDTFEIDSALGLRFMPLAFPIQTKCKAYVHFFYQRTKNLWRDFQDFIYGNSKLLVNSADIIPPYIKCDDNKNSFLFRTGGLGDYLGLPTVSYDSLISNFQLLSKNSYLTPYQTAVNPDNQSGDYPKFENLHNAIFDIDADPEESSSTQFTGLQFSLSSLDNRNLNMIHNVSVYVPNSSSFDPSNLFFGIYDKTSGHCYSFGSCLSESVENNPNVDIDKYDGEGFQRISFSFAQSFNATDYSSYRLIIWSRWTYFSSFNVTCTSVINPSVVTDSIQYPDSPYRDPDRYHISSLPFRCYESIYNAFYRDDRNNPRYDSQSSPVYNKYLESDESGIDNNNFMLHNRNWEYDQFTSAVQSPQQGVAPLVGISSLGDLTFSHDGKTYTFQSETAADGDTITGVKVTEDVPNAVARSIVNVATSGISINDFRNVNSFQRWLETNIRRGLKYKDQTLARWGVEPSDVSLDMPEFIGGYSVDVDINTVTNVSASNDSVLGDYAANATAFGGSNHKITKYCDQHGFIMAILSVVPTPVYTQTLPRMFSRNDALSYYSPEFGQIGMQAIRGRDICPLQCSTASEDETVFGYQRPWFDYIYSNDEAHGLFRTDFNQFLLSRTFSSVPRLGPDFTTINQSSLNDIFSVKNQHNILGMIRFNIVAKRPIPSVSLPKL
ncbi:putative VP1 [Microviridae sp.]|nr:putative VP1 [Microviridae sp.]